MEVIETVDFAILDVIQSALRCHAADAVMAAVSRIGGGVIWIMIGIALLFFQKYRLCGVAMLSAMAAALLLTEFGVKLLVLRERPYLLNPEIVLAVSEPSGTSFPSAHTSTSFASAIPLFRGKRLWGIFGCCLAALVGFSRLYLYVHFPSDVLVGAILGVGLGLLSSFLCVKFSENAGRKFARKGRDRA